MTRTCQRCGAPLHGRIDQKFCCDACRIDHHNEQRRLREKELRAVNRILSGNWRILSESIRSGKTRTSVAELAAADCAGDTVWVWGYIVGTIQGEGVVDFVCDTTTASNNLAIAASTDTRDAAACAGIYLSKAAHKKVLSLNDPANKAAIFHKKIYVQGKVYTYKKFPALTNLCEYQLE